jgi:formate/nitrite transporter FocA (FNT family)
MSAQSNRPARPEPESGKHESVHDVFDPLAEEGQDILERSALDLTLSGLIAGLDIGFGPLAMAVMAGRLHQVFHVSVDQAIFYGAFLYPLGFVFVIMGKSELFTEDTLAPVAGLLADSRNIGLLIRSWIPIATANIVGAIGFSLLIAQVGPVWTQYLPIYRAMGTPLVSQPFLQALLAAILAGWLVALIGWLIESTKGSIVHFFIIYVIAYLLIALTLFHSIIGSIEVLTAMFAGAPITWLDWLTRFLIPALIGNAIGGAVFVTGLKGFQAALTRRSASPDGGG